MKAKEIFNENYFPRDDNYSKADGHGDRKPHLTLSHLNRLRKIKEKKAEDKPAAEAEVKKEDPKPDEAKAAAETTDAK